MYSLEKGRNYRDNKKGPVKRWREEQYDRAAASKKSKREEMLISIHTSLCHIFFIANETRIDI